jgi:phosphoribosylformylglycinamidine synthase subunit PurQ / glutaminase
LRYVGANPNGSAHDIAGIANPGGNVVGMMPHPERAIHPMLGSTEGAKVFESIVQGAGLLRGGTR